LTRILIQSAASAGQAGHRALVVVEAPAAGWLRSFADAIGVPFVSSNHTADRADRITALLGQEFATLVHETGVVIDAGLLAALAGTVKAGGVLLLGLPFRLDELQEFRHCSRFNQRLARLLLQLPDAFPGKAVMVTIRPGSSPDQSRCHSAVPAPSPGPVVPSAYSKPAGNEQDLLLSQARQYLTEHSRGCITITGRRGRGKSTLLARIASWGIDTGLPVSATAAQPVALNTLYRWGLDRRVWVTPSAASLGGKGLLLVDEAGSLPINTLIRFLDHHDQVIFCTTVEGYESAGRAFALRFLPLLQRHRDDILALQPEKSWRWADGDPLEHLVDTLLLTQSDNTVLLNRHLSGPAQPTAGPGLADTDGDFRVRRLFRSALANDENLLRQVFGLFRQTHYQTTAADLSHLLDGIAVQVWVLERRSDILAALLLAVEGNIDTELHEAIVARQRRLPHQLLPQLLAQCANQAEGLAATYARIIRIAVRADARRCGLGSRLLQQVEHTLVHPSGPCAAIGASFAIDEASIAFWQANGYIPFHTGFRRNPRTGKQAVAVIRTYEQSVTTTADLAIGIHVDNQRWRDRVGSQASQADPDSVDTAAHDNALLLRFARGQRSLHDTFAALNRLQQRHEIPLFVREDVSRRQHEAMLRAAVRTLIQP
jgi:tRNA(Met) cytidine acetyltransferase